MKYSVGYSLNSFIIKNYIDMLLSYDDIEEIYFSYPGLPSGRNNINIINDNKDVTLNIFFESIRKIKKSGKKLNLLLNSPLYNDMNSIQEKTVNIIHTLDENGCKPDIITVTLPDIGYAVKKEIKDIDVRISVINNILTILLISYIADFIDSFYLSQSANRNMKNLINIYDWCKKNNKKLGLLVNSGCIGNCPYHIEHYNCCSLESDTFNNDISKKSNISEETYNYNNFNIYSLKFNICAHVWSKYDSYKYIILNATWIRPEDIKYIEDLCDIVKLSTRTPYCNLSKNILDAYILNKKYDGNLLDILDFRVINMFYPNIQIDNTKFPSDFFEKISHCNKQCEKCLYCKNIAKTVIKF